MQAEVHENNNAEQADILKNPQSLALKGLLDFCHNCELRAAYQKHLRQQLGLSAADPVSIPSPGVPTAATFDTALSPSFDGSDDSKSGYLDESSKDFYDPRDEENDWTDAFVTDQEEQERGERDRKSN